MLTKRRGQAKKAISDMIKLAVTFIDDMPTREEKFNLIGALRDVTDGKIFVEVEYARCTKQYAEMKEEDGQIDEATDTIQEVQIETYGSMEKKEKLEYILYQLKLVLLRKDYVRTQIILKKISRKGLNEKGLEHIKLNYYNQIIEYYNHEKNHLEVAKCYQILYDTMTKVEDDGLEVKHTDPQKRKSFENFVIYTMISPYSHEQVDILNIIKTKYVRELEILETLEKFVHKLLVSELMPLNEESVKDQMGDFDPFIDITEHFEEHLKLMFKQIIQHNLRVIEKYYQRIQLDRLSALIGVGVDRAESEIADMVINNSIVAKINRLAGSVKFGKKEFVNDTLNNWNHDIKDLLSKIDKTCHLINREKVVYEK